MSSKRQALSPDDAHAVAGQGVRVGGGAEHLAEASGGHDDRLGGEHVDLPGGQLVGHHAADPRRRARGRGSHQQVEDVELVVELDVVLDALLVERLQDHVAGAVGGVAGPAYGGLPVVARVPPEATLVDAARRRCG